MASKPALRAAVSFCASIIACCDGVLVAKLALFNAAMAASASAPVPVPYVLPFHSKVALGPYANLAAAKASPNDVTLGPAA